MVGPLTSIFNTITNGIKEANKKATKKQKPEYEEIVIRAKQKGKKKEDEIRIIFF